MMPKLPSLALVLFLAACETPPDNLTRRQMADLSAQISDYKRVAQALKQETDARIAAEARVRELEARPPVIVAAPAEPAPPAPRETIRCLTWEVEAHK